MTTTTIRVRLIKPHTHNNQKHAVGEHIEVTEPDAAWLIENQIAALDEESAQPQGKKK